MSKSKALIDPVLKVVAIGLLPLAATFSSYAHDVGQMVQLEKELQEIKLRLAKLESVLGNSSPNQKPVMSGEGWKSLSNWRQLKSGMNPNDARTILGEPSRINGGEIARWFYQNGGDLTFMGEKLYQWTEPQKLN